MSVYRAPFGVAGLLLLLCASGCQATPPDGGSDDGPAVVRRQPGLEVPPKGGQRNTAPKEGQRNKAPQGGKWNILLITVDTLRADALGSYGKPDAATPWMDRLAAAGVRFDDAHAHNVLTLPSHANILSGLRPQEHGVRDNSGFRFPAGISTLASVLSERGYRTGAFVSAFPLDSRFGLDRGFEVYEDSFVDATSRPVFFEQERPGPETVALARSWLAADDGRPTFCWLHLYEPHFPYAPPAAPGGGPGGYQGDVAAADAALAPVLEPILAAADAGDTLVVLTSDHGEALGEHGEATHGIFAYESTLKVPLILYQPRLLAPRVVGAPARHVDLMPTILDALGVAPPAGLAGRSLWPMAAGEPEPAAPAIATYFEALSGQLNRGWAPLYGVIHRGAKYIDLPIPELYDLADDPAEARNLAAAEPQRLAVLRDTLAALRALDKGADPSPESDEVLRRLESLGYVSGTADTGKTYTADDDPKRLIALDAVQREIADRHAAGDLTGALERARELVRRRPGMRVALLDLAQLERESGDFEAAARALGQALALAPGDPATLAMLAATLTRAGRPEEAVEVTATHALLPEPDVDVLLTRGLAFARLRQPRQALAVFERAREIDPENPKVPIHAGTLYLMAGRREEAADAYRQALALNPNAASAHVSLAVMATEDGRPEAAIEHWRAAVAADPQQHARLFQIAGRLWAAGRTADARPLLELFVAAAPADTYRRQIERARGLLAE